MKNLRLLTLGVALAFGSAYAQTAQDKAEQNVTITQGPTITNITGISATAKWTTDKVAANQVKYRPVSGGSWKSEFESQGSKDHQLQLSGLQPNTTYEYQIMTRQGNVRTSGQFKTASTASGTAPDVQGTGGTMSSGAPSSTSPTSASSSGSSGNIAPNANFTPNAPNGRVTLYRALNPANNAHIYVTSQGQIPSNFKPEGIAGYLIGRQAASTVPVYAMSHPNGDFLYTTNSAERESARGLGYTDAGIIGYIASNQQKDTVPLYRMMLKTPAGNMHFYTSDPNERNTVVAQGAIDEGTVGYVWSR
jgi:hypothetical protein